MKARAGDRLVLEGNRLGDGRRVGTIVAVRHADGGPRYVVRWRDTDHEALIFPGPDARVEPAGPEVG
jgi:hypothetical protein